MVGTIHEIGLQQQGFEAEIEKDLLEE